MKRVLSTVLVVLVSMVLFCGTLYAMETVPVTAAVATTPCVSWFIMGVILAAAAFSLILSISSKNA